ERRSRLRFAPRRQRERCDYVECERPCRRGREEECCGLKLQTYERDEKSGGRKSSRSVCEQSDKDLLAESGRARQRKRGGDENQNCSVRRGGRLCTRKKRVNDRRRVNAHHKTRAVKSNRKR